MGVGMNGVWYGCVCLVGVWLFFPSLEEGGVGVGGERAVRQSIVSHSNCYWCCAGWEKNKIKMKKMFLSLSRRKFVREG